MMSDVSGIDQRLVRALAHPLRARILRILGERVASPVEMSNDLDEPLGNVSYHVKVLREAEAVEEVRNEPRRGAVEHFYKATSRSSFVAEGWEAVPLPARQGLAGASFASLASQVVAALEAKTFENRDGSSISWQPLSLDERGWSEIVEILKGVDAQLKAAAKKSRRRLKDQDGISVVALFGAFELAVKKEEK
jgi:DNA-binding transcriptional ArsR family regulator